jgi:hypothetical protein
LYGANLSKTDCNSAMLEAANLFHANLSKANLSHAIFSRSTTRQAAAVLTRSHKKISTNNNLHYGSDRTLFCALAVVMLVTTSILMRLIIMRSGSIWRRMKITY